MKRMVLIAILLVLLTTGSAQVDNYFNRPKVGVVLSGGGAKGVAHISALRAIEEAGLPIDIICGTSMGALIGGLYSIGWSTDELDSMVRHQDWASLLTDRTRPEELDIDTRNMLGTYLLWHAFTFSGKRNEGAGFFRGINLDKLFDRLLAGYLDSIDFNTLPIPFACVATDIITNTEIDFHSGHLKQAMRASMSIPGVFSPVRFGDMLLVDGGMRNNYPADVAREMGADIIIGVAVLDDTLNANDITGPAELLMQIIDINCKNKLKENLAMSDILMMVDVKGYSGASFNADAIDTLLRRGAEEAERHRDELNSLRQELEIRRGKWDTHRFSKQVTRSGDNGDENKLTAINPVLNNPIIGVSFRFDNEETGAIQIGALYPFTWYVPMELNARIRLGKRLQFSIENMMFPQGVTSPSFSYSFQRNDIDFYRDGIRTFNAKYMQHIVEFAPINSRFRKYKIQGGLRFDYYYFFDPILSAGQNALVLDNQRFFSYFFESLLNNENDRYFPTAGNHFLTTLAYRTDNLVTLNDKSGLFDLSLLWRISLSPTEGFTFRPTVFSRLLFGDDIPIPYCNFLGSRQQLIEQQFYFPGVHSLVQTDAILVGSLFNFQFTLDEKHFLLARIAAARQLDYIEDFFHPDIDFGSSEFLYGFSLGYAYNSFLGPIELNIGYSTLAPNINFHLNIGHFF